MPTLSKKANPHHPRPYVVNATMFENSFACSGKQAGIAIFFLLSFCIGTKGQAGAGNGILKEYYKRQVFAKNESGRFMRESERIIVDSLFPKFGNSTGLLIIKEYCDSYNLSGCIYSLATGQTSYFSRTGRNGLVVVDRASYNAAPGYYKKIMELARADSLRYYKTINDKQLDAEDESCWLYVTSINTEAGKYEKKEITFYHPLAFRRLIINY